MGVILIAVQFSLTNTLRGRAALRCTAFQAPRPTYAASVRSRKYQSAPKVASITSSSILFSSLPDGTEGLVNRITLGTAGPEGRGSDPPRRRARGNWADAFICKPFRLSCVGSSENWERAMPVSVCVSLSSGLSRAFTIASEVIFCFVFMCERWDCDMRDVKRYEYGCVLEHTPCIG